MTEAFKTYLNNMTDLIKKVTEEDHVIHGNMIYMCRECGSSYIMHLEKGLEDPTEDAKNGKHKSVPFTFTCVACGGLCRHVLWNATSDTLGKIYQSYNKMVNQPNKVIYRNFFWNDPESDCGIPVLFEPDTSPSLKWQIFRSLPDHIAPTEKTYLDADMNSLNELFSNIFQSKGGEV